MAKFIYPTEEQWEMLRELGLTGGDGVIALIRPDVARQAEEDGLDLDALEDDYDTGGEPDVMLDIVSSTGHYLYALAEEAAEEDE